MMSTSKQILTIVLLSLFGLIFLYPLLWLLFASFKPNREIFTFMSLWPKVWVTEAYAEGWRGLGKYGFDTFFKNTLVLTIPTVIFTVLSSTLVAYGFARFRFPGKKVLFALMLSTLMLPDSVLLIPRYLLFRNLNWLNTYLPFYIPALLAVHAFFIFLLVQFLRGLPRELDEAAYIDGCGSFAILIRILIPLSGPALISAALFQFIWTWNDFFNALIFINSVSKFTVSLGLRMTLDTEGAVHWNRVMAMSVLTILPCIMIFFMAQKYFVEGISTTGLKG